MMRMMKADSPGKPFYCAWRQNEQANNCFDKRDNTIYMNSHRVWRNDLKVWQLPTDRPELTEFLSKVEGQTETTEYVPVRGDGLLVIARRDVNGNHSRIVHHHHVLDEEYFRYDWPSRVRSIDRRDTMHTRGWTYFTVEGQIGEERISGVGRLPFVYAASEPYYPWLKLEVGNRIKLVDSNKEAVVYDGRGMVLATYGGGSFFKGLGRPWVGLHTIDTVRRDAAEQGVSFYTKYQAKKDHAEVILNCGQDKLVYTIDMQKDVIDRITISTGGGKRGELKFSYLQEIDEVGAEFVEPIVRETYRRKHQENPGMLWLVKILTRE
jgi:hypothetical protein